MDKTSSRLIGPRTRETSRIGLGRGQSRAWPSSLTTILALDLPWAYPGSTLALGLPWLWVYRQRRSQANWIARLNTTLGLTPGLMVEYPKPG